jgi:hypothetical protein
LTGRASRTRHRRDIFDAPSGPGEETRMTCTFRLVTVDGAPANPPSLTTVAPKWEPGDTIPLGLRTLRVVGVATTTTNRRS